jgi:hypothetical protein
MQIRDRVKELRRVKASVLRPHPQNWRTHPASQRNALRGVLAEIGYADALLARELPDGSLQLIDGHLRAETTPDAEVPVLILDLDDRETAKLLALLDPLAGLAEADHELLSDLVAQVETQNAAVQALLDQMLDELGSTADGVAASPDPRLAPGDSPGAKAANIPEAFQVVIECRDEAEQREVFERMTGEGFHCRLLTL